MLKRLFAICILGWISSACSQLPQPPHAMPMYTGHETLAPFGYVEFCQRHSADCTTSQPSNRKPKLSAKKWQQLQDVNRTVNAAIAPITDQDLYNTVEYWTYPVAQGDCEDYVLEKRRRLIANGWPADSLLISVALDSNAGAHAVLIAMTDKGDFVLDNQTTDILPWHDTPYVWDKRQSIENPMIWVSLEGATGNPDLMSASLSEN